MPAPKTRRLLTLITVALVVSLGAIWFVLHAGMLGSGIGIWVGERAEELRNAHAPITAGRGAMALRFSDPVTPMLPKPVHMMDNDQLYEYLNSLVYDRGNGNRHRTGRCRSGAAPGCPNAADRVSVLIQPEWGAYAVPLDSVDSNGVVLARIINYGSAPEGRYDIPAGRRAWWLVDRPVRGGPLRSRFIIRTLDQGKPVDHDTVAYEFYECQHEAKKHSEAKARWRDCGDTFEQTAAISDGGAALLRILPRASAIVSTSGSTWVTCTMGCCVAGAKIE